MTWLVFAVSCLLVLAGAISVITGAPYIQLERGWTEVIAGTMALSSGGVVFGLAVILLRLEGLRETFASRARAPELPTPVAAPPVPDPLPVPVTQTFEQAAPEAVAPAIGPEPAEVERPVEAGLERHGLWKRVRRSDNAPQTSDEPTPHSAADTSEPLGTPPAPIAEEAVPPVPVPQAPVLPAPIPAIEPADEPRAEGETLGWLDRSLLRPRPKPAPTPIAFDMDRAIDRADSRGAVEPSMRLEPRLDTTPSVPAGTASETAPAAREGDAAPVAPEPTIEPDADEVTVIGRYQAGVASYVMYSDGTIEVETEGGELHRFASMDELKTFIAQQDSPVA